MADNPFTHGGGGGESNPFVHVGGGGDSNPFVHGGRRATLEQSVEKQEQRIETAAPPEMAPMFQVPNSLVPYVDKVTGAASYLQHNTYVKRIMDASQFLMSPMMAAAETYIKTYKGDPATLQRAMPQFTNDQSFFGKAANWYNATSMPSMMSSSMLGAGAIIHGARRALVGDSNPDADYDAVLHATWQAFKGAFGYAPEIDKKQSIDVLKALGDKYGYEFLAKQPNKIAPIDLMAFGQGIVGDPMTYLPLGEGVAKVFGKGLDVARWAEKGLRPAVKAGEEASWLSREAFRQMPAIRQIGQAMMPAGHYNMVTQIGEQGVTDITMAIRKGAAAQNIAGDEAVRFAKSFWKMDAKPARKGIFMAGDWIANEVNEGRKVTAATALESYNTAIDDGLKLSAEGKEGGITLEYYNRVLKAGHEAWKADPEKMFVAAEVMHPKMVAFKQQAQEAGLLGEGLERYAGMHMPEVKPRQFWPKRVEDLPRGGGGGGGGQGLGDVGLSMAKKRSWATHLDWARNGETPELDAAEIWMTYSHKIAAAKQIKDLTAEIVRLHGEPVTWEAGRELPVLKPGEGLFSSAYNLKNLGIVEENGPRLIELTGETKAALEAKGTKLQSLEVFKMPSMVADWANNYSKTLLRDPSLSGLRRMLQIPSTLWKNWATIGNPFAFALRLTAGHMFNYMAHGIFDPPAMLEAVKEVKNLYAFVSHDLPVPRYLANLAETAGMSARELGNAAKGVVPLEKEAAIGAQMAKMEEHFGMPMQKYIETLAKQHGAPVEKLIQAAEDLPKYKISPRMKRFQEVNALRSGFVASEIRGSHFAEMQSSVGRGDYSTTRKMFAAAQQVNPLSTQNGWLRMGRSISQLRDDVMRTYGMIAWERKGLSTEQAAWKVLESQFPYENFAYGKIDQVLSDIMPFWKWSRNNIPFQLKTVAQNPQSYIVMRNIYALAERNSGETEIEKRYRSAFLNKLEVIPVPVQVAEGVRKVAGWISAPVAKGAGYILDNYPHLVPQMNGILEGWRKAGFSNKEGTMYLSPYLPYWDLNQLEEPMGQIYDMMHPFLKMLFRQVEKTVSGGNITERLSKRVVTPYDYDHAPTWLNLIDKAFGKQPEVQWMIRKMTEPPGPGETPQLLRAKDGTLLIKGQTNVEMRELLPFMNTAQRLLPPTVTGDQASTIMDRHLLGLMGFFMPVRFYMPNVEQEQQRELHDQQTRQNEGVQLLKKTGYMPKKAAKGYAKGRGRASRAGGGRRGGKSRQKGITL
jgi:hypothetical protein